MLKIHIQLSILAESTLSSKYYKIQFTHLMRVTQHAVL